MGKQTLNPPSSGSCRTSAWQALNAQRPIPKALIRSLPALSPSPLGFRDLCRGFRTRSIREQAVQLKKAQAGLRLAGPPRRGQLRMVPSEKSGSQIA
jgi:hypothetical protein